MAQQPTFEDAYLQQVFDRAFFQATQELQQAGTLPSQTTRTPEAFQPLIANASQRYQVDPRLVDAVMHTESNYNPRAVSKAGAQGLMQLMPGTASALGVRDPFDPEDNIEGGAKYLAQLSKQFNGDLDLTLAAYNAGPHAVTRFGGIPPYAETRAYVSKVKRYLGGPVPVAQSGLSPASQEDVRAVMAPHEAEAQQQAQQLEQSVVLPRQSEAEIHQAGTPPSDFPLPTPLEAFQTWWNTTPTRPLRGGGPAELRAARPDDVRLGLMTPEQRAQQAQLQGGSPATLTAATPEDVTRATGRTTDIGPRLPGGGYLPGLPQGQPDTAPPTMTVTPIGLQRPDLLEPHVGESLPSRVLGFVGAGAVTGIRAMLDGLSSALGQYAQNRPDDVVSGLSTTATRQALTQATGALQAVEQGVAPRLGPGEQPTFWDKLATSIGTSLPFLSVGGLMGGGLPGALGAAVTEALSEAGSVYQALAPLVGDQEANTRAMKSFGANVVLVSLTDRLGIFGDAATTVRHIVNSIITNGVQEAVQYDIERRQFWVPATHPDAAKLQLQGWQRDGDRVSQPFSPSQAGEAALIGMVVGGAASAALSLAVEEQVPEVRRFVAHEREQAPGFTLEQALEAAQAPETPPADVEPATWQRWAQAVLNLLPEASTAPTPTGMLTSQRGAVDLFGNDIPDEGAAVPEQPTHPTVPDERQPSPEQLGLTGVPQQTTFALSPALARATPNMGTVTLDFTSELDKALYIIGNPQTQSANHDAYLQEVMDFLRVPERTALLEAQQRRDTIVAYARKHGQAESTLRIPDMGQQQAQSQAAAQPGLEQPGVMPTVQAEMALVGNETTDMQGLPLLDATTMANLRDFLRMVEGERAETLEIDGKPLEINYDHIATDDGVKQVLSAISEIYMDEVAKVREPRPVEQTREQARQLQMTIEQFLTTDRENLVSRKKALVGRQMATASARQLKVATALFRTGQLSGRDLLRTFAVHGAIQIQFARLANEAGGALQIFSAPVEGDLTSLKGFESIMEYLGSQQVHPDLLAQMIEATPTPEQLTMLVEQTPEATLRGQLLQAWYGVWLLGNPKTLLVNFLGGLTKMLETPLTRGIAARLPDAHIPGLGSGRRLSVADATRRAAVAEQGDLDPRILAREHADRAALFMRDVEKGEATAMLYSDWHSLVDAWRIAQIAFATGEPQITTRQSQEALEGRREPPLNAANLRSTGTTGQILAAGPLGYAWDAIGAVARTVSHGMLATDEFFKFLHKRRELHAIAWRQAVQRSLAGGASLQTIGEEAEAFVANPPPTVNQLANQAADKHTFTSDLRDLGALGRLGAGAQDMANYAPIARLFFPFIRTPVNITFDNFEKFPITAMLMKTVRADLSAGGARRDLALAKMTLGASAFGLLTTFAAMGYITGGGPDDPEERQLLESTEGWQPYSLYVPTLGRYFSYRRLDPWAQYMGFAADWVRRWGEAYSSNQVQEAMEIGAAGAMSFADNIVNRNYMQGMASLVELWSKKAPSSEAELSQLTRFANRTMGSLVPSGVANLAQALDPRMSEVRTFFDMWVARLPFTDKTPRLDFWADPVEVGHIWWGVDFFNPFPVKIAKGEPLSTWLRNIHADVAPPSRMLLGSRQPQQGREDEPVEHTPASWNRLKMLFAKEVTDNDGRTLRPALEAVKAQHANDPVEAHGEAARAANRVIQTFKEAAQKRFLEENSRPGAPYYDLASQYHTAQGGRKVRANPGSRDAIIQQTLEQLGVR